MQTVDIYIATSIKGPRRQDGSYLYIIAVQTAAGTADAGDRKAVPSTTENQLALLALRTALKRLNRASCLRIYLECFYVAAALENKWYSQWREHDWMNSRAEPVCDAAIWQDIERLLNVHEYEIHLKEQHPYLEWMHRTLRDK